MELLTEAALPDREQGMPKYRRSVPVGNRPITSMGIAQARLPGGGSINLVLDLKNQKGETLMKGSWTALILSRP